ncbi:DUF5979 domain-containing protein [Roseisolibacter agri]|uniref:Uncharacterized protein n=1 Tax=Roseisolibacter agri TaxID=2014610 RepID=A0AA37QFJ5_9BACT|nr:DUF5979 domain-containing protein [Roseisolibacter agri]GLC24818.1 hypothetical protein rosag_13310 [Roseisolibacter agri]
MRRLALAALTAALAAAAVASCRDAAGPIRPALSDPPAVRLARGAAGLTAICHAAGRAEDPRFVELRLPANAVDEHLGEQGTPMAGHEQDYLVTERTPCPPPDEPGEVRICKVGAAGIPAGTPFSFVVNGEDVTVSAGACTSLPFRVGTTVNVAETVPANMVLMGLTLAPAAAGTTDLAAGTATVVAGTDVATLTFTNRLNVGFLKVCKASSGTPAVTGSFTFNLTGVPGTTSVSVPVGQCVFVPNTNPVSGIAAGTVVTVTEVANPSTQVGSITCVPTSGSGSCATSGQTATVTIAANITSEVTFANRVNVGFLKVCKASSGAAPVTGSFAFNVSGIPGTTSVTVPVGQCVFVPSTTGITAGTVVTVTEILSPNTQIASITCVPTSGPGSCTSSGLAATVTIGAGLTSEITFTNRAVGQLQVCKTGGVGVSGAFAFAVGDGGAPQSLTVPVGACVVSSVYPVGTVVTITETIPGGFSAPTFTGCTPTGTSGQCRVTIVAGTNTVTFNNTLAPTGQLQVCKVAGTGVTVGTNFSFGVSPGGATYTVSAGTGPAGNCVLDGTYPAGTVVTITETIPAGYNAPTFTGCTATGTPGQCRLTIVTGTNTVTFNNTQAQGF